jgi:hypothetical protein
MKIDILVGYFYIYIMDSVTNYLEDTEKKLAKEMAELFSKMREQREVMSLKGIEDMYSLKPLEGVLYEPCVSIPGPVGYYCSEYKLPKGEYVIYIRESSHQQQHGQSWGPQGFICMGVTNYGRCFITKANYKANDTYGQVPTNINHIIKVEPLPYKMSSNFSNAFILGLKLGYNSSHGSALFSGIYGTEGVPKNTLKYFTDTTISLQELNKEFYLFAGKWQPYMTEHATLDVDKMRQTIIENSNSIQDLSGKNRELEQQNKKLEAELQELKEQKASLEKEKARLLPLEKYKEVVIDFMDNHYGGNEPYDHDDTLDTDIIKYFSDWHSNKVFMDQWLYDDVMESKEELNEYRIYKKVKGEMVSNGMDNSSVARNVLSIKKGVNKLNNK